MIGGTFFVARALWEDDLFRDEPFSEREAFLWLIAEAAFKPRVRDINGLRVQLQRGQLATTERYVAERWGWSRSRSRRFLERLQAAGAINMLRVTSGQSGRVNQHPDQHPDQVSAGRPNQHKSRSCTVVTLCNYEKYQSSRPAAAGSRGPGQTRAGEPAPRTSTRTKTEERISEERSKRERETCACAPESSLHRFDDFWNIYPHRGGARVGRSAAEAAYVLAVEQGAEEAKIVRGAMRFQQDRRAIDGYAPDPHRWLDARGWEDDIEPPRMKPRVIQGGRANERRAFNEAIRQTARGLSDGSFDYDNSGRDPFAKPRRGDD